MSVSRTREKVKEVQQNYQALSSLDRDCEWEFATLSVLQTKYTLLPVQVKHNYSCGTISVGVKDELIWWSKIQGQGHCDLTSVLFLWM